MALTKIPRSLSSTPSIIDNGDSGHITIHTDGSIEFNTAGVSISAAGTISADSVDYATVSYVDTELANLVDSSPTTLDTLNELAAALGDDPNFATTTATSIGTKWTQDNTKIGNWDTAFGWGNHASAGYVTSAEFSVIDYNTNSTVWDNKLDQAGGTISGDLEVTGDLVVGDTNIQTGEQDPVLVTLEEGTDYDSFDVYGEGSILKIWDTSVANRVIAAVAQNTSIDVVVSGTLYNGTYQSHTGENFTISGLPSNMHTVFDTVDSITFYEIPVIKEVLWTNVGGSPSNNDILTYQDGVVEYSNQIDISGSITSSNTIYGGDGRFTNYLRVENDWEPMTLNAGSYLFRDALRSTSNSFDVNLGGIGTKTFTFSDSDINVGIGTTTPANKLHVYGGRLVMDNPASGQSAIQFNQAGTEMGVLYRPANVTNQLRMFITGNGDTMTWSSNGYVGIGTVSPSAKLDVVGNIKVSGTSHYGNFGSATFSWDGSTGYPTLFSDHQDRWVMITNPHVPFLVNGVRGHTGGNLGSVIQFEGSTTGDQSQKVGVYTGYEGQLCMGPTNKSTPSIRVNNEGTVYLQERKVTGNLRRFQKYVAASPSVTTDRLLTYSRGWWGSGNVRIKLYANYYGPSSQYIEYAINGHTDTRYGGAAPSFSTVTNDGGGTGGTTGTLAATNWDQTNGVADVEITLDGYRQVLVVVEAMTTVHGDRAGTYGDGNSSIWLDGFTEIL